MKRHVKEFSQHMVSLFHDKLGSVSIKTVTFQVTNDCCCRCSYCYEINKGTKYMTKEQAKKAVDLLFDMYEEDDKLKPINKDTTGIIIDFIGGEPLMNIDVIDYISSYFLNRCISEQHPWLLYSRFSMISNGKYYFTDSVQKYLKKFRGLISFTVTVDGPKELHDSCRVYKDGSGNYDDAMRAIMDYKDNYQDLISTKVTIAKENLQYIDKIVTFFYEHGFSDIFMNPAFEPEWDYNDASLYYKKVKKCIDFIDENNLYDDLHVSTLIEGENFCHPRVTDDDPNWCGGTGSMLCFSYDGNVYPCVRYTESSIPSDYNKMIIGNITDGIYTMEQHRALKQNLDSITLKSQSTQECINCPVALGCAWCSAWNYQCYGTPNKRCTNICPMHKARSLFLVYYWNKYYISRNIPKVFHRDLPDEDALKIISKEELSVLDSIERTAENNMI